MPAITALSSRIATATGNPARLPVIADRRPRPATRPAPAPAQKPASTVAARAPGKVIFRGEFDKLSSADKAAFMRNGYRLTTDPARATCKPQPSFRYPRLRFK